MALKIRHTEPYMDMFLLANVHAMKLNVHEHMRYIAMMCIDGAVANSCG